MSLPRVALSINQPWAWLVAAGYKPIENRDWNTDFRGAFAIHAGLKVDTECYASLNEGLHPVTGDPMPDGFEEAWRNASTDRGGIVGVARLADVVTHRQLKAGYPGLDTSWFVGRYGLVCRDARLVDFTPCVGALGFFEPDFSRQYKPKPEPKPRQAKAAPAAPPPQGSLFE